MLVFKLNVGWVFFFFSLTSFRTVTGSIQFNYLACLNASWLNAFDDNETRNKTNQMVSSFVDNKIQANAINSWCDKNPTNMKNACCNLVWYISLTQESFEYFHSQPLRAGRRRRKEKQCKTHHNMFQQIFGAAMIPCHVLFVGREKPRNQTVDNMRYHFCLWMPFKWMSENNHNWNEKVK